MKPRINYQQFIIIVNGEIFNTEWYSYENNYVEGMIVIDLLNGMVATDGKTWKEIEQDHL